MANKTALGKTSNSPLGLSQFSQQIQGSPTLALTTLVTELRRQGRQIIDLGAGEPDFPTPSAVCQAGVAAINDGFTKYTPNAGTYDLREAIANQANASGGNYSPENVLVCNGAKHAIYNALLTVCDPGDEVIIPSPYWTSYPEQVKLARAKPVLLEGKEENGFKITADALEDAISEKTKLLILNSPNNPTGTVYTKTELDEIVTVIAKKNIYVLSDEIYSLLVFNDVETTSLAAFPAISDQLLLVNGLSKSHAMTGWRIGYLVARKEIVKAAAKMQSHATSNISSITQAAGLEALRKTLPELNDMKNEFDQRRKYVVGRVQNLNGFELPKPPEGAFYVFPNVKSVLGGSVSGTKIASPSDLAAFFLESANVATVPGEAFGSNEHIRISYTNSMENLEQGLNKIAESLESIEQ